jgi:hypothetical protein
MMIELYEEALEEALELEAGEWYRLSKASSRGDTTGSIATLAAACAKTGADLSPLNDLHELYGIFRDGSAVPDPATPTTPINPFDTTHLMMNLERAFGSVLLAYDIVKAAPDTALPGCSTGDLVTDPAQYRKMLMGGNGLHVRQPMPLHAFTDVGYWVCA